MTRVRVRALVWCLAALVVGAPATALAQQEPATPPAAPTPGTVSGTAPSPAPSRDLVFDMGEIVVVGSPEGLPGVGGSVLTRDQMWTFDRNTLDQAVNVVPGVVSTFDANGRRNESDIFVRGFGRWQVPLMLDGVRIYLPADNRLDFSRFLTADIAEVQIQKGYASVLDGPGAMGGAINLVTRKPTKTFEAEASGGFGGRSDNEGWNGYAMAGTRQPKYYLQGSVNYSDRDFWTLSGDYQPRTAIAAAGRAASELGQRGLAPQPEGRVHAQHHRRIHVQLHQAGRRERRAAQRHTTTRRCRRTATGDGRTGTSRTRRSCARRSSAPASYVKTKLLLQHLREWSRRVRRRRPTRRSR